MDAIILTLVTSRCLLYDSVISATLVLNSLLFGVNIGIHAAVHLCVHKILLLLKNLYEKHLFAEFVSK